MQGWQHNSEGLMTIKGWWILSSTWRDESSNSWHEILFIPIEGIIPKTCFKIKEGELYTTIQFTIIHYVLHGLILLHSCNLDFFFDSIFQLKKLVITNGLLIIRFMLHTVPLRSLELFSIWSLRKGEESMMTHVASSFELLCVCHVFS